MTAAADTWLHRLHLPGSPTQLAVLRIIIALHVFAVLSSPAIPLLDRIGATPYPLAHSALPDGLADLVDAHLALPLREVGLLSSLLLALGLFTRTSTVVTTVCFFVTQHYWFRRASFHDDWLYLCFDLLVLCFARSGDALALDSKLPWNRGRTLAAPQAYRWPIEAMILGFAFVYVSAGLAKLLPLRKGLLWLDGSSAQAFAGEFALDAPIRALLGTLPFDLAVRWPFMLASWATVLIELGAGLLLWTRRSYAPVFIGLVGLHAGIWMFGIPGFVQIAFVHLPLFLDPRHFARMDARLGRRRSHSAG